MAVTTGRHAVAGLEYFVEITEIVVSHMQADICHSEGSIPEQVGCLVQSFFLEQILVIFSCQPLDDAAQPIEIIAQFLGQRGQFPVAVAVSYTHLDVYKRQAKNSRQQKNTRQMLHLDREIPWIP